MSEAPKITATVATETERVFHPFPLSPRALTAIIAQRSSVFLPKCSENDPVPAPIRRESPPKR
jgi:hypothetical protein